MLVLCINSGNGHTKGYPEPMKGIVYKVLDRYNNKLCTANGCSKWYKINDGTPYIHSVLLFEPLPDDILSVENADLSKLIPANLEVNKETEKILKELIK